MKSPLLKVFGFLELDIFWKLKQSARMKRTLLTLIFSLVFFTGSLFAAGDIRIALLSDVHILPATNTDKALHQKRFQQAIAEVNTSKVDFVLIAGDLTEFSTARGNAASSWSSKRRSPRLFCISRATTTSGNKLAAGRPDPKDVTTNRVAQYEAQYGPSFWAKEQSGLRIIGINSSLIGTGYDREKEMWTMLEKELAKPSEKTTLVMIHHPPFQRTPEERSGYYNIDPAPRQKLLTLFKQGGVKAVFSRTHPY